MKAAVRKAPLKWVVVLAAAMIVAAVPLWSLAAEDPPAAGTKPVTLPGGVTVVIPPGAPGWGAVGTTPAEEPQPRVVPVPVPAELVAPRETEQYKSPAERAKALPRFGEEIFGYKRTAAAEVAATATPGQPVQAWVLVDEEAVLSTATGVKVPAAGLMAGQQGPGGVKAPPGKRLVPVLIDPRLVTLAGKPTEGTAPGGTTDETPGETPAATAGPPAAPGPAPTGMAWTAIPGWPYPVLMALPEEQAPTAGQPTANAPVPPNYVLGPGDTLEVRVWSRNREQVSQTGTVTAEGFLVLPQVGKLQVAGQSLGQVREALQAAYRQFYTDPTVTVTVAEQRVVEVYVTGEARRPGKYALTGMATVFTALYAAGGPAEIGSYRRLLLTRVGQAALRVDLYDFLLQGRRDQDVLLQPGDTLFVPALEAEVAVEGEVRRPARYELAGETTVAQALAMAGGMKGTSYAARVELWRAAENREWRLLNLDCSGAQAPGLKLPVQDADLLSVPALLEETPNTVRLIGAVRRPGLYPVTPTSTLAGLLQSAENLSPEAHLGTGVLKRLNADLDYEYVAFNVREVLAGRNDVPLQGRDVVEIFSQADVEPPLEVEVRGPVVKPGRYEWSQGMRVSNLVLQAGGVSPEGYLEYAYLLRLTADLRRELVKVNLPAALARQGEADVTLARGDVLELLKREDAVPAPMVHITGFVRASGDYPRPEGMRVSDLIMAAGGLQPGAGPNIEFTRGRFEGEPQSIRLQLEGTPDRYEVQPDVVLADDDNVSVTGRGGFQTRAEVAFVQGEVKHPGSYAIKRGVDKEYTLYDLLQETGGLLPEAYPAGMVLYRLPSSVFTDVQNADLGQIFRALNRGADGQPRAMPLPERETALEGTIAGQVTQVLSTETGVAIVMPPTAVGPESVSAIPVDGRLLMETEGREGNLELQPWDTLIVPRVNHTVTVLGAVARPGAVSYQPGRRAGEYLSEAGGFREDAAEKKIVLVHANGSVEPLKGNPELHPGDVLVVPSTYVVKNVRGESSGERWLRYIVSLAVAALVF